MENCEACGLSLKSEIQSKKCICPQVDAFFEANGHLMEALDAPGLSESLEVLERLAAEAGQPKCLACFFHECRCQSGLRRRLAA